MSKGIGKNWWKKFWRDTNKDYLNVDNKKIKIPRYYDKLREQLDPESLELIKQRREQRAKEDTDNTRIRRRSKAIVKEAQYKQLKRGFES